MINKKNIIFLFVIFLLTLIPISSALASPLQQDPTPQPVTTQPIVGTINQIVIQGDPTLGTATVQVTLTDANGVIQTVDLSIEAATSLGLVVLNPDGTITENATMIGTLITIDATLIIPVVDNKVANAIADFFATLFGTDAATIMSYHEDGMGFGVIAQAGFMAYALGGDGTTMEALLLAKQSGDFSAILLPDGTTASNWGQLRKAILTSDKSIKNLGSIMSGRANETPKEHGKPDRSDKPGKNK